MQNMSNACGLIKSIAVYHLNMMVNDVAVTTVSALWHTTMCASYVSQLSIIIYYCLYRLVSSSRRF